ncbi:MAG TPA: hydrogenase 3 maturation endopeptidase HyCI, partial [Thermococcus litoralis]|nr:hydrogenase 3 maturation endopeptidase HyCI [Thermococcus litoralis]
NVNAKFILIGAQPKQTGLFVEMSKELRESAERLISILERILAEI